MTNLEIKPKPINKENFKNQNKQAKKIKKYPINKN